MEVFEFIKTKQPNKNVQEFAIFILDKRISYSSYPKLKIIIISQSISVAKKNRFKVKRVTSLRRGGL